MATIEGATEIRFEPEDERFGVYMRIGDTVYEMQPPSKQILQALVECIRELAGTGPGERTGPKPGAFPFRIGNSSYHPTVEVSSTESGARAVVSFVPVSAASGR
jgi:type II secretory ATPase GspE/PulE/Tfp pilus assembly ATPase PilB-like protein